MDKDIIDSIKKLCKYNIAIDFNNCQCEKYIDNC